MWTMELLVLHCVPRWFVFPLHHLSLSRDSRLPSHVEFRSSVKWHILHCRNCLLLPRCGNPLPIHNHWKAVLLTIMSKLNHSPAAPMALFLSSTFIRI